MEILSEYIWTKNLYLFTHICLKSSILFIFLEIYNFRNYVIGLLVQTMFDVELKKKKKTL